MTTQEALQQYFGYQTFRPMQQEIIAAVLDGKDTLVLMPTGGGKSICYQIPAIVSKGTCIVVSPLIALMQDQVQALQTSGVAAAFMNSAQDERTQAEVRQQLLLGKLKLLYVSPEKLLTQSFLELLNMSQISFFAIDEAHCVSQWGHDFRPEYSQLQILKEQFPGKSLIALTATADKVTREDIITQLHLTKPAQFVASFDRKNLRIEVSEGTNRLKKIISFLKAHPKEAGIIYCLSRKSTETLCEKLAEKGHNVGFYHAGMSPEERARVQNAFLKDDIQVMCATIAFGMGIDKSNVRFVIHYNLPKNIEGYYQEIGRAGRDGLASETLLFYSYRDVQTLKGFIDQIPNEQFKALQEAKLERMKQYAEAQTCRRKILLSYFGEVLENDCGYCDVCENPRKQFDGTILAQKALSAAIRTKEEVGLNLLIDILRGARNQKVLEKGYHTIKTYGAGKEVSAFEWKQYLQQMINQGVLEVAYDQHYALQRGGLSQAVLQGKKKIFLVKPQRFKAKTTSSKTALQPTLFDELFEKLRKLRKQLADEQRMAHYLVFNDATLTEMARERPTNQAEMLTINGVGHRKMDLFGTYFLEEIQQFIKEKTLAGKQVGGNTYQITYEMLQQGLGLQEIARKRNYSLQTIQNHLVTLYEKGHNLPLADFIHADEVNTLVHYWKKHPQSTMKACFEHFQERFNYFKIRLSQAIWLKSKPQLK
ncbi:MAG: DNA helicase RecQ [Thermonemataceae bacterium]